MRTTALSPKAQALPLPNVEWELTEDLHGRSAISGIFNGTFTRATIATGDSNGLVYRVASGEPRYGAKNDALGVLIEDARTNILLYSDQFDDVSWGKSGITVNANVGIAPDGLLTMDRITFTASATDQIAQNKTLAAGTYTLSWYARTESGTKAFRLDNYNATDGHSFSAEKTATTTVQRFTHTFTVITGGLTNSPRIQNDAAGTAGSMLIWGAQLENAAFPSSYIPTTSAAVTRNADQLSYPLGSWFNTSEGTIVCDVYVPYVDANTSAQIIVHDGTLNNRIELYRQSGVNQVATIVDGGVTQVLTSVANKWTANGQTSKLAISWKLNDVSVYMDGTNIISDTTATIPTGLTILTIGNQPVSSASDYANYKNIKYYQSRLSNADLVRLTR